ncbi:MAG: glycosyltransferase family 39 protein [Chloroflexota bacterium]|nr:glycosyltransferase family 39 protein [Chloroflexota bacterium]
MSQLSMLPIILAGSLALAGLLVLPGFRIAARLAGAVDHGFAPLALAIAASTLLLLAVATPLLAIGRFSGEALAVAALVLAAWSLPSFLHWLRQTTGGRGWWTMAWIAALVVPWLLVTLEGGFPPADRLQWYYAGLGRQLSAAGGIPVSVAEWGRDVRWLPDYLVFDVVSRAHAALLPGVGVAEAISAWRLPVAALSIATVFAVLRLWIGRSPALLGTALLAGGTFFLAKFNAYKPEALGILLGLVALWLVIRGLRSGRRTWILVGGLLFGADLSVHAIAAVAMGLLAAGFGTAEWLLARRPRLALAGGLVRAVALGLALSSALGVALQGRAIVASQALAPAFVGGEDPTWTFLLHSTGVFSDPLPAPPARPLAGGVSFPWDGFRVTSAFGWWLLATIGVGVFLLAAFGGRRGRAAALGIGLSGALLGATIAFFALAFATYVPRWTGLVRFGQYVPLGVAIGLAFGLDGYLRAWARLADRPIPRLLPLAAAVIGVAWLVPWVVPQYAAEPRIQPAGFEALVRLDDLAGPHDVVISNILTAGTIESFTGTENPLEARQPLIEEPALLVAANDLLVAGHRFFESPADRAYVDRLGAQWVLVADDPAILGATATLGGSTTVVEGVAFLRPAWVGQGIAIYGGDSPVTSAAHVDRVDALALAEPTALAAIGFGVLAFVLVRVPGVRLPRPRPAGR